MSPSKNAKRDRASTSGFSLFCGMLLMLRIGPVVTGVSSLKHSRLLCTLRTTTTDMPRRGRRFRAYFGKDVKLSVVQACSIRWRWCRGVLQASKLDFRRNDILCTPPVLVLLSLLWE